eukprot:723147-Rhodomonas_salina.1
MMRHAGTHRTPPTYALLLTYAPTCALLLPSALLPMLSQARSRPSPPLSLPPAAAHGVGRRSMQSRGCGANTA